MKSVLIIASTLMALSAEGKTTGPADSLKISKDISLDEVVVTATKVAKGTPVAYSELTKDELNRRNDGQGIPFLILQSPSVIMTSDAGTGIGYSGFRIRGTDANRINITVNGVPVNDSESHTVFWVNMPDFASSVDNIQIQRGAGTSTNGAAAFGATVAMQTQKSELVCITSTKVFCSSPEYSPLVNTFENPTIAFKGVRTGIQGLSEKIQELRSIADQPLPLLAEPIGLPCR